MKEHKLLSKVIDNNNFYELAKYNVNRDDFYVLGDVYDFLQEYTKSEGHIADYRTVVEKFEDFEYEADVVDSVKFLCKEVKSATARRGAFNLIQNEATQKFNELSGDEFIKWLYEESKAIRMATNSEAYNGTNFAVNGRERKERYKDAEQNGSGLFIPTPYPRMTSLLHGGFELGDYVLLQAYTNRGKSWLASQMAVKAWEAGHGVIYYSPELTTEQQERRFDVVNGHFRHNGLRQGDLEESERERLMTYFDEFNETNETPLIIKTMADMPNGLSLELIEADLYANPNVDMIVVDGFNLMNHKGYDKQRNNMSGTSRGFRTVCTRHKVVGLMVHQIPTSAEKENRNVDELGARQVEPPRIDQYSETVAVIQDACTVLNFDQADGRGQIRLAKTRVGNVDEIIDLHCDFDRGFIEEPKMSFNFDSDDMPF